MRDKSSRYGGSERQGQSLVLRARDKATLEAADVAIGQQFAELDLVQGGTAPNFTLTATLKPAAELDIQAQALKQNITTLHNRINELGVSEPVIQQQVLDRIVVQLPGVQDTATAKDILGRTATL